MAAMSGKKNNVLAYQLVFASIGFLVVAALDTLDVIHASGPGSVGAIRAGVFYGVGGGGGGMIVGEIVRRVRDNLSN